MVDGIARRTIKRDARNKGRTGEFATVRKGEEPSKQKKWEIKRERGGGEGTAGNGSIESAAQRNAPPLLWSGSFAGAPPRLRAREQERERERERGTGRAARSRERERDKEREREGEREIWRKGKRERD